MGGGGLFGGGGGGGGGNAKATTRRMNQYVADTQADNANLINAITNIAAGMQQTVQQRSAEYLAGMSDQERTALNRLERANNWLTDETNQMSETFARELQGVLNDLDVAAKGLNLAQRDEITAQISEYKKEADQLDTRFQSDISSALGRMDQGSERIFQDYRDESLSEADRFDREARGEIGRFDSDTRSLADIFRSATGGATDRFRADAMSEADRTQRDTLAATDRFAEGSRGLAGDFDRRTTDATDSFRADSTSLGDRYLESIGRSMDEYRSLLDRAENLTPERLNIFTQAADFISNAAVDTRARMLASADPRALELSAIADENAAAMMSGRISADTQANLARSSAMRALQGGFGASSEMGRGLSARDLGLTSLDLQQRGMQDFERQRMLNYNTRVAGLQTDATGLLRDNQQLLAQRAGTTLQAGLNTAESDRNQRQAALGTELTARTGAAQQLFTTQQGSLDRQLATEVDAFNQGAASRLGTLNTELTARTGAEQQLYANQQNAALSRMNTSLDALGSGSARRQNIFDTALGGRVSALDTRTQAELGAVGTLYNAASARGRDVLGLGLANTGTFFDQERARAAQRFNTNSGLASRLFDVGLSTAGSLYGTNVNAATDFFRTGTNALGNVFQTRSNAASQAATLNANAQSAAAANLAAVRAGANSQIERAYQQDAMIAQQQAADRNSMWSSIINTGATLAGAAIGTAAGGNTMLGAQLGSMAGGAITGGGGGSGGGGGMSSFGMFGSLLGNRGFSGYTGFTNNPATGQSIGYAAPTAYRLPGTSNWVT